MNQYEQSRAKTTARGYDGLWQRKSKAYLRRHPLCAECERQGIVRPATCVDHIVPHRGNEALRVSESNWQGLCEPCHGQKTRRGE
ncbi:HNH endonuclease [Candidatus Pacearchaeota archaeon]|nr:HNH endonuclease [Candidatus Pacearchaeota archaeon]